MREGADRLLKLLGDISEELVEEAAEEEQAAQAGEETDKACAGMEKPVAQGKAPRKKKKPWLALGRLAAAAACLCLVLGVARLLGQGLGKTGQMDEEAAMDMAESTAAGAEAGEGAAAPEEAAAAPDAAAGMAGQTEEKFDGGGRQETAESSQPTEEGAAEDVRQDAAATVQEDAAAEAQEDTAAGAQEDTAAGAQENTTAQDPAFHIQVDGAGYRAASPQESQEYGLIGTAAPGEEAGEHEALREYLGEKIGTVEDCQDPALVGAAVYAYEGDEDGQACIVEMPDGSLRLYVRAQE